MAGTALVSPPDKDNVPLVSKKQLNPSFDHFLEFVKDKLIVQRSIFYSKGQKAKFLSQWKPLLSLL